MKRLYPFLSLLFVLTLTLSACSPAPASNGVDPTAQNIINTSVASTLSVVTTQLAKVNQATATPEPSKTPEATLNIPTGEPPAATRATICDWAAYVADISYPDGTMVPPGTKFTKTWEIKNIGTCAWTTDYTMILVGGNPMGAPGFVLPMTDHVVNPGEKLRVSVPFVAPEELNKVSRSYWKFRNAKGEIFGVTDPNGDEKTVWVEIKVGTAYDLLDNRCLATWRSSKGDTLPCNGSADAENGTVYQLNTPQLEGGVNEDQSVLVMVPPKTEDGTISGQYPPVVIYPWSRFQARVGCLADKPNCNVKFKITYSVDGSPEQVMYEDYHTPGAIEKLDIPLNKFGLEGKSVVFILYVTTNGEFDQDYAFWMGPRIDPKD